MINFKTKFGPKFFSSKSLFRKFFCDINRHRFENKVFIITGGSCGIGRATCLQAVKEGAKVVIADINENCALETHSEIIQIGEAFYCKTDISNKDDCDKLMKETINKFGKLDVLVNCAAKFVFKDFEATREDWTQSFMVNELGLAMVTKAAVQHLVKTQGNIVNLASIASLIAIPNFLVYSASKAAIVQMTRNMALNLAKHNIRVNSISPGLIQTATVDLICKQTGISVEELTNNISKQTLLKRLGKPEEIANVILFLASSEASYITGTNLVVDGGYTAV